MSVGDSSNFATDENYKLALQRQFGLNTVNTGKFSSYLAGNNVDANNGTGPSTSAAAAVAAGIPEPNGNNMTVAKFNRGGGHEDIMRLSTELVPEINLSCSY